ncbi:MAG: hypothetical protein ACO2OO_03280 [Candidatus Aenigmatarchaeota archaeon]
MALKSLTLANFIERTGWDYEIALSGNQNLYRHLRGIPVIGSNRNFEGGQVSLMNCRYSSTEIASTSIHGSNIIRFAYSRYNPNRLYVESTKSTVFAIEDYSYLGNVGSFGDTNNNYHMLDTGNNRVAGFSRTQSQVFWKYEDNLSGIINFTPPGTIIINNPRVFMFWKNYWYIASPNDHRIQVLSPDFSSTVGTLNLAITEGVYALINLNNSYLGIVVIHKNSLEPPKRLYLWDGNWLNIYFHRLQFNKEIRGSILYNGITYLFFDDGQNTEIYAFSPSGLKFVRRIQNLKVTRELVGVENHPLSSISAGLNFVVIPTFYSSVSADAKSVILWYPEDDLVVEIDPKRSTTNTNDVSAYYAFALKDQLLVFYLNDAGTRIMMDRLWVSNYLYTAPIGTKNEDFYVETNWLNLNNSNYVKIHSIEVFTENLAGRTISASIEYMREKTRERGTLNLPPITQSGYQRIENIGLVASKFKLKFSYRGSSNQDPFLFKKVIITYDDEA